MKIDKKTMLTLLIGVGKAILKVAQDRLDSME